MNDTYNIVKEPENKNKQELRDAIIDLNFYLLAAIDLRDRISYIRIRKEISEVMKHYKKINK